MTARPARRNTLGLQLGGGLAAAGVVIAVLGQTVGGGGRTGLAAATIIVGGALAASMGMAVHFALAARRRLRQLEAATADLEREIGERQQAEETLSDTAAHYRSLFDNMLNGCAYCRVLFDADGRADDFIYVEVNPAFERLTGLTAVIGRRVTEVLPGIRTANPEILEVYGRTARSGEPSVFETFVAGLGSWYSVSVYSPQRDHVMAAFANITLRKRALDALRDSEERFRAAFEHASIGMALVDPDRRLILINGEFAAMLGYTREELLGRSIDDITYPDDMAPSADAVRAMLSGEVDRMHFEKRYVRRDGGVVWARVGSVVLRDADGAPVRFCTQIQDITEARQAADALRQSGARWRAIFEHAGVGIMEVDAGDRYVAVNDRACEILGYRRDELLGMTVHELTAPADRPQSDALNASLHDGLALRFENEKRYLRRDGTSLWVHVTVSALLDASGRRSGSIGTIEDISVRRQAEEDLHAANRRKDEIVAELARSNAELERFAYIASHDLQEPLRTTASFTQLLAKRYKDRLDGRADEYIGFILDGVSRMQTLIADLLALSRVGTEGRPLQPTSAGAVLADALRDLRVPIEEAGATVTSDPLPLVRADSGQLGQLFRNLLSNALKFRSSAPARIHVSARRDGDAWVFSVADNGIGIAPEYFDRIFVIFQRLHTRLEYPGTGMGLAICKKIVERHGGRIWVETTAGGGATFLFSLPGATPAAVPATLAAVTPGRIDAVRDV